MKLPRFRDPRDAWPPLDAKPPAPLPGPHGQQRAILAMIAPSLSEERRAELAVEMLGQRWMWVVLADVLQEHEPSLFDLDLAPRERRRCRALSGKSTCPLSIDLATSGKLTYSLLTGERDRRAERRTR